MSLLQLRRRIGQDDPGDDEFEDWPSASEPPRRVDLEPPVFQQELKALQAENEERAFRIAMREEATRRPTEDGESLGSIFGGVFGVLGSLLGTGLQVGAPFLQEYMGRPTHEQRRSAELRAAFEQAERETRKQSTVLIGLGLAGLVALVLFARSD